MLCYTLNVLLACEPDSSMPVKVELCISNNQACFWCIIDAWKRLLSSGEVTLCAINGQKQDIMTKQLILYNMTHTMKAGIHWHCLSSNTHVSLFCLNSSSCWLHCWAGSYSRLRSSKWWVEHFASVQHEHMTFVQHSHKVSVVGWLLQGCHMCPDEFYASKSGRVYTKLIYIRWKSPCLALTFDLILSTVFTHLVFNQIKRDLQLCQMKSGNSNVKSNTPYRTRIIFPAIFLDELLKRRDPICQYRTQHKEYHPYNSKWILARAAKCLTQFICSGRSNAHLLRDYEKIFDILEEEVIPIQCRFCMRVASRL